MDYMYSEDTATEDQSEEQLRETMKQREKEFYGDDLEEPSTEQATDYTDGSDMGKKELSSK